MHRMRIKFRVLAPALLALAALFIGGVISTKTTNADVWGDVNMTEVNVAMFVIGPIHTACTLESPIAAGDTVPMEIACQQLTTGWPDTGKLLIYNYGEKSSTKIDEEVFEYDQNDAGCTLADNELCVTSRAIKGTSAADHEGCTEAQDILTPGCASFVKWATQLTSAIDDASTTFSVESCDGFILDSSTVGEEYDEAMIGTENIGGVCDTDTDVFTIETRGAGCSTTDAKPTTQADHAIGDVVSQSDVFAMTLGRIEHNKGDNTMTRNTITYNGCQLYPVQPLSFPENHPFDKADFPYDFAWPGNITQSGTYDKDGHYNFEIAEGNCLDLGVAGLRVTQTVTLNDSKDPFDQHKGFIVIIIDATPPYDCEGQGGGGVIYSQRLAGKEDVSPADGVEDYLQFDSDGDNCPNFAELGTTANTGGSRDPWNHWDYFEPTQNGQVRVNDIMAVVGGYGLNAGDPGYSTLIDRGGVVDAGSTWNQLPPNGQIRVGDILGVVGSYGHDCSIP